MDPKIGVHGVKKMGRSFLVKEKASIERPRHNTGVTVHDSLGTHLGKDSLML